MGAQKLDVDAGNRARKPGRPASAPQRTAVTLLTGTAAAHRPPKESWAEELVQARTRRADRSHGHPKLKALLVRGGTTDTKVHCAYTPEVSNLVSSYVSDHELSRGEWLAGQGFVERTPPENSLSRCAPLFDHTLKSSVSWQARLEILAQHDCAASRSDKVRGTTISSLLDPDRSNGPKDVRLKIMRKFADCIAF